MVECDVSCVFVLRDLSFVDYVPFTSLLSFCCKWVPIYHFCQKIFLHLGRAGGGGARGGRGCCGGGRWHRPGCVAGGRSVPGAGRHVHPCPRPRARVPRTAAHVPGAPRLRRAYGGELAAVGSGPSSRPTPSTTPTWTRSHSCAGLTQPLLNHDWKSTLSF